MIKINHPTPAYLHLASLIVYKASVAWKYAGGNER
jgi:hypothetical protein